MGGLLNWFKGVNPKSHHTKMPTATPRRNGNTGDQSPPGHSNIGLPNHDVQRSQLDTPPGMLHPAVMVPRRVTTPADVDRAIRDARAILTGRGDVFVGRPIRVRRNVDRCRRRGDHRASGCDVAITIPMVRVRRTERRRAAMRGSGVGVLSLGIGRSAWTTGGWKAWRVRWGRWLPIRRFGRARRFAGGCPDYSAFVSNIGRKLTGSIPRWRPTTPS